MIYPNGELKFVFENMVSKYPGHEPHQKKTSYSFIEQGEIIKCTHFINLFKKVNKKSKFQFILFYYSFDFLRDVQLILFL